MVFLTLRMGTFVWAVREQPGGDNNVIEPVVFIIFIHNLIAGNETAPRVNDDRFLPDHLHSHI